MGILLFWSFKWFSMILLIWLITSCSSFSVHYSIIFFFQRCNCHQSFLHLLIRMSDLVWIISLSKKASSLKFEWFILFYFLKKSLKLPVLIMFFFREQGLICPLDKIPPVLSDIAESFSLYFLIHSKCFRIDLCSLPQPLKHLIFCWFYSFPLLWNNSHLPAYS